MVAPPPAANPQAQAGQKPPFGNQASPTPSPNRGYEAAGLQRLGLVMQQLSEALPMLGPSSEAGQAVLDAMKKLGKFVPPGSVTPAGQQQMAHRMLQSGQQNNQQMQALQRMQQPPGGAGGAPQGAMQGAA